MIMCLLSLGIVFLPFLLIKNANPGYELPCAQDQPGECRTYTGVAFEETELRRGLATLGA